MEGLRITKVERDPAGFWRAHLSRAGVTIDVDNRHGSWQTSKGQRRDVLPYAAKALQDRVRQAERAEAAIA